MVDEEDEGREGRKEGRKRADALALAEVKIGAMLEI